MKTNYKRQRIEAEAAQYEEEYRMMCEEPIDDTYDMDEDRQNWQEQFNNKYYKRAGYAFEW